ncbi:MAG: hypothetical protein V4505_27870 [Pseudomonadota bacterium]
MSGSNSSDRANALEPDDHLLGLTVHTLPEPGEASQAQQRTRQGRWKMLLVMLICAAPVIGSYFTYYVIRPSGHGGFGELIADQPGLPDAVATARDGSTVKLPSLKGQWLLVSVGGGACDKQCEQYLYLQRQLREGLGRDRDRVDWVWLVSDAAPVPAALDGALHQATVLRVAPDVLARWLQPAAGHQLQDHLYLVDPMGHWMMRFPAGLDKSNAAKAKADLARLLRASDSWDKEGR